MLLSVDSAVAINEDTKMGNVTPTTRDVERREAGASVKSE
jgi:hypothetical protein